MWSHASVHHRSHEAQSHKQLNLEARVVCEEDWNSYEAMSLNHRGRQIELGKLVSLELDVTDQHFELRPELARKKLFVPLHI